LIRVPDKNQAFFSDVSKTTLHLFRIKPVLNALPKSCRTFNGIDIQSPA